MSEGVKVIVCDVVPEDVADLVKVWVIVAASVIDAEKLGEELRENDMDLVEDMECVAVSDGVAVIGTVSDTVGLAEIV